MTRETLPAFLIAGKTLDEIEVLRYQVGSYAIAYRARTLGESLNQIQGGPFWYRISMQFHLYKRLLPFLLGRPLLRGCETVPKPDRGN
jgi:hypothetical protein